MTGAIADFVPFMEDVHEGLAEFALWIVLCHIAFVVALTAGTKLWRRFRAYLTANAGQIGSPAILRITEQSGFRKEHRFPPEFPPELWQRPEIRTPSHCLACHPRAEQGR